MICGSEMAVWPESFSRSFTINCYTQADLSLLPNDEGQILTSALGRPSLVDS